MSLKVAPSKIKFSEYLKERGLSSWDETHKSVLNAYCDCLPEHVEREGLERDLRYFNPDGLSLKDARAVLSAAIPDGYNSFDVEKALDNIEKVFGNESLIFIARESSVCLYVKVEGSRHVWFDRKANALNISDEFSFIPALSMFRLWWD